MMIYEGLFLGLQFLWNNLRHEVDAYAKEHFENQANEAQNEVIDDHEVNRVPSDDEPSSAQDEFLDNGNTSGVSDEGSSFDM
jgi:hypothetical protein